MKDINHTIDFAYNFVSSDIGRSIENIAIQDIEQNNCLFNTGLGRKIVDIKTSYALRNSILFGSPRIENEYSLIEATILKVASFMVAFGRSFLLLSDGREHDLPLTRANKALALHPSELIIEDGQYLLSSSTQNNDRNQRVHASKIIEFNYHLDYIGRVYLSEFSLIGEDLRNDQNLRKVAFETFKKNSTVFYKVKGYLDHSKANASYLSKIMERFSYIEKSRSVYGASMIDADSEDVLSLAQTLPDLTAIDNVSLRRLAMVSRIPLPMLVGESVQGLNSSGTIESDTFDDMIYQMQHCFLKKPLMQLFDTLQWGQFSFKENSRDNTTEKLKQEQMILQNALLMQELSLDAEDIDSYLAKYKKKLGLDYV